MVSRVQIYGICKRYTSSIAPIPRTCGNDPVAHLDAEHVVSDLQRSPRLNANHEKEIGELSV